MPVEQAYATLLDLQPELGTFETSFTASAANEHDAELLWDRLTDGLDRLLGPDADVSDPLLRTHATWHVARVYLATKMDLLDEVDKED